MKKDFIKLAKFGKCNVNKSLSLSFWLFQDSSLNNIYGPTIPSPAKSFTQTFTVFISFRKFSNLFGGQFGIHVVLCINLNCKHIITKSGFTPNQ